MDFFGHKAMIAALERENTLLRESLSRAQKDVVRIQAEYLKIVDRLCAKQGIPESPAEIRKTILDGDLFEEEPFELVNDNRQPVDTMAGSGLL